MKRLFISLFLASSLSPMTAGAQAWEMVGRSPLHDNFVEQGPSPPFRRAWQAKSPDPESSFTTWPVVKNGVVYVSSGPGVMAVDASDGLRHWFFTPEEGQTQVAPALEGGAVFIPLPFGRIVALSIESGEEMWRFQAEGSLDSSPTLAEGRLYFGSAEGKQFYCLDAASGRLVWKVTTEFEPDSVAAVSQGIVVVSTEHVGSPQVLILGLDAATGAELWRVEQKEENSSPSILGSTVVFGGGDSFAYAVDLKTGKQIWKSPVEDKFGIWSMPAIAFGDVFFADRVGNIYRLDGTTGQRMWVFKETEGDMAQSFPVVAGKTLFIGSGAGFLYALDVDSGRLLWKDSVQGIVLSGAADTERFYFGVKFGDEGLYAYEHDPEGKLEPPPPAGFRPPTGLLTGLLVFLLLFGGFLVYARRRRSRAA
jgi:outer membrane protein assembly factor BamB